MKFDVATVARSLVPERWRASWHKTLARLDILERNQLESEMLLELLASDARHPYERLPAFNGQLRRQEIVTAIFATLGPVVAIETGTYLGATTAFISRRFGVPTYSSEVRHLYYSLATRMLRDFHGIELTCGDSRDFIRRLTAERALSSQLAFFYLDAHWYQDLPLREEMEIIAQGWEHFVVMVDDFCVPWDTGYGFDRYGKLGALEFEYLSELIGRYSINALFPSAASSDETGKRRGCVVLTSRSITKPIEGLRKYSP